MLLHKYLFHIQLGAGYNLSVKLCAILIHEYVYRLYIYLYIALILSYKYAYTLFVVQISN